MIDCLPLPASLSSLGTWCCTQFSTFTQLQFNEWIKSQLPSCLPAKLQPPDWPPLILLQIHSIWASKCISKPVLATGPGLDRKNGSVWFQTRPKTRPTDSWRAKPGPVPVNLRASQGLARPVRSNLRFCVSGFTFMVAFRYATANRKVLTLVCRGSFSAY